MISSCLPVIVHIPEVFSEPFFQASVGLANVLLLAVSHTAGDSIAQVPRVAVHLGVQLTVKSVAVALVASLSQVIA